MSNISSPGCDAQPDDIVYQSESPSSAGHCRNGRPGHGPRPILTARRPARIGRTPVEANVSLTSPPVAANSNLASAQSAKQDEFYMQLPDIERELRHYRDVVAQQQLL